MWQVRSVVIREFYGFNISMPDKHQLGSIRWFLRSHQLLERVLIGSGPTSYQHLGIPDRVIGVRVTHPILENDKGISGSIIPDNMSIHICIPALWLI